MWDWQGRWEAHDRARQVPQSPHEIYDQSAFRHFLALERRRAERRGRSLVLLLVDMAPLPRGRRAAGTIEQTIFGILETCVRESDFLGWYTTARIAGAVLVQGDTPPPPDVCHAIGQRVTAMLKVRLPGDFGTEVRVLTLAAKREEQHG
jgi:hypothetical protein